MGVHLRTAQWATAGKFRCEVTAEDFETASKSAEGTVVAVPKRDPYIEGNKHKYSPGEVVELNCTSNSSDPEADLFWYINALPAGEEMLVRYPRIREPTNLLTAMLLTVYLKSNEITFEVKRPQKLPALESREENGRGSNSGGNSVIQDQTSSNLNSLDTKVHHKDEQTKQKSWTLFWIRC